MLPKEKVLFHQHMRRMRILAVGSPEGASRLAQTALTLWLKMRYPELSLVGLEADPALADEPRVQAFASWLDTRELLEGAFWLSSAYAHWVGDKVRSREAMYFTPPVLSNRLIDALVRSGADLTRQRFMDPACGGAAFLAPLALRMRQALLEKGLPAKALVQHVIDHVLGAEFDATLCRLSGFFLKMALYEEIRTAGEEPKFDIRVANSLTELEWLYDEVDVVLCNPPYRKMPSEEVDRYRPDYARVIEGQPNLYTLFFKLSVNLIKPSGLAGLLTPTSFLSGQYFSSLRSFLFAHCDALQIDLIPRREGVFVGVLQETAITVLRRLASQEARSGQTQVFVLRPYGRFEDLGTCKLPGEGCVWPVPQSNGDSKALHMANGLPYRLEHYGYRARIGAFVWNRDKRDKFASETEARRWAKAPFPLIWSSDIGQDGSFCLQRGQNAKHKPFVDMECADSPSVIRRPCVVLQRVTSSDQTRRLIGAAVDESLFKRFGGVVGENHVVFLEPMVPEPALSPAQLAEVLRSLPIDRLFRTLSGATNVSVYELMQLPLPDPQALREELTQSLDIDIAVMRAFQHTLSQKEQSLTQPGWREDVVTRSVQEAASSARSEKGAIQALPGIPC